MNLLAGVLIFVACTYAGLGIDNYYKSKVTTLKDFLFFINFTLAEISHLKTNIFELIKKHDRLYPSKLSKALMTIENPVTVKAQDFNLHILNDKERALVLSFVRDVTRLDTESHKAYIEDYKHKVNKLAQEMQNQRQTKGNLAKKLAPLLGLGIMIVIL